MYFDDHNPPHFHAIYGDQEASMAIDTLSVIEGRLSPRAMGLVVEWASQHRTELLALWERATNCQPLYRIPPLA